MSISNGRKQIDAAMIPPIQNFPIDSTATVEKEEAGVLTLKVSQVFMGGLGKSTTTIRIVKAAGLSNATHSFLVPDEDKSNRKPISDVNDNLKKLSLGVVQLKSPPDAENLLSSNSSGSGTGYFLSASGLMMTNHHVIDDFKTCMQNLVCEIDFNQVLPDGIRRSFTAKAALLVFSQQHDFALLKVNPPKDLKFSFFNIERQKIGPQLITLGYPGDIQEGNDASAKFRRFD